MFVDRSAIVAILASEAEAATFAAKLEPAKAPISAGHVILEAAMRLSTLMGFEPTVADRVVTRLLREARIEVVPITEEIAHLAVAAFERYGNGHDARLNFGCAKAHDAALLFKGDDFIATDIARA